MAGPERAAADLQGPPWVDSGARRLGRERVFAPHYGPVVLFSPWPTRPREDGTRGRWEHDPGAKGKTAWNAGRKLGAKRALKPQQVWAIRFWLDSEKRRRDRVVFDLAIDSKLRGCDIVAIEIEIGALTLGGRVRSRAVVVQQKTKRPVQFELLDHARGSLQPEAHIEIRATGPSQQQG